MSKYTYTPLASLLNPTTATTQINANFAALQILLEELLSRDGTAPNTLSSDLDMNSQRILNLPAPVNNTEPARLIDLLNAVLGDLSVLSTTQPTDSGILWNNGGFLCIS